MNSTLASATVKALKDASWIRRMFEAGAELRAKHGDENVFDFSLGNPILEPPKAFTDALARLTANPPKGIHRYMPNPGFPSTRNAVATAFGREQNAPLTADDIVMTVGAAGALNVALHSLIDPGDEVIVIAPYFVEYLFYAQNHGGIGRVVESTPQFDLDVDAIKAALCEKTKVILLNSPNNPTGRIYPQEDIQAVAHVLRAHKKDTGRTVYILWDTPYGKVCYDGKQNPKLFSDYSETIVAHSYSKELGLAGERIGFLAVNPEAKERALLSSAFAFNNRVLGFVNAPALIQRAIEPAVNATVHLGNYARLRDLLVNGLREAGYSVNAPDGAFYVFLKAPIEDDVEFAKILKAHNVLVVPGRGFGRKGHVRISFCVEESTVSRAIPQFAAALEQCK